MAAGRSGHDCRLLNGAACCHLLSGLTGTLPTANSTANLGLVQVTGIAYRRVGVITGTAGLKVRFDEFRLWPTLDYPGRPLPLAPAQAVDASALLALHPQDEALDAALLALSSALIQQLADRVHTRAHPDRAELRLEFAH